MAGLTLITTMKNEAPFILEWVAHYRTLGFDNIIICTNDCGDPTVRMARRLEHLGLARHHATKIRPGGIHRSALRQAMRYEEARSADWIFICDADEFLNIHAGAGRVSDLISAAGPDADVISVPWRNFGPNGQREFSESPVTEQFTMAERPYDPDLNPGAGKFVKSLFRNNGKFQRVGLHYPILREAEEATARWVHPDGTDHRAGPTNFETAQVNHYPLRALDSFLVKRDRGRANHMGHDLGLDYWDRFDFDDVADHSIRRYDAEARPLLEELQSDFRLRRHQARAADWHRAKAQDLRSRPEWADFVSALEARIEAGRARIGEATSG
ncbi:MAG: glycosyltransferase family 2 protein [Rhodobacteraceae bacterium]|nr:glycosyltransferase family 2 protein [Paracoccaceae bacterium]